MRTPGCWRCLNDEVSAEGSHMQRMDQVQESTFVCRRGQELEGWSHLSLFRVQTISSREPQIPGMDLWDSMFAPWVSAMLSLTFPFWAYIPTFCNRTYVLCPIASWKQVIKNFYFVFKYVGYMCVYMFVEMRG